MDTITLEEEIILLEKKVALLKELKALEMQPVYVPYPVYPIYPVYPPSYPSYPPKYWPDWTYYPASSGTITTGDIPSATSGSCSSKDFGGVTYTAH